MKKPSHLSAVDQRLARQRRLKFRLVALGVCLVLLAFEGMLLQSAFAQSSASIFTDGPQNHDAAQGLAPVSEAGSYGTIGKDSNLQVARSMIGADHIGFLSLLSSFGLLGVLIYVMQLNRRLTAGHKQSQAAESLFRDLAETAADWVWQTDTRMRITHVSDGFTRTTGYDPAGLLGYRWEDNPFVMVEHEFKKVIAKAFYAQEPFHDIKLCFNGPEGEPRYLRMGGRPYFDQDGVLAGYRGVGVDVTDLVEAETRARYLHKHDGMTGLPNRLALREELGTYLKDLPSSQPSPILLGIDLERFRSVNEAYGAAIGDQVILQCAERIRVCLGSEDMLARYGNDEFIVLVRQPVGNHDLDNLKERLEKTLAERYAAGDNRITVNSRIAVYQTDRTDLDAELCLKRLMVALRRSKMENISFITYSEGMDVEAEMSRKLEEDLLQAIRRNELLVNYQPQLSLTKKRVSGCEALVRWRHHEFGLVSPARFIPLAEQTGIIIDLSRWVFRQACMDARQWDDATVAINLSTLDFSSSEFCDEIIAVTQEVGIDPRKIELEVTESALITDANRTLNHLNALKRRGFRIALDDFGTGYAGLGYLQLFPFDKLKIDQSFVKRLETSHHAMAIVGSVIALGHDLDLTVCGEGVETKLQLQALMSAGCDVVQGYFTGPPMTATRFTNLLKSQQERRAAVNNFAKDQQEPKKAKTGPFADLQPA